tara:strand:- start:128 stop:517 length:390 start_codon:yes stop_codon:yes gene_type:complete
MKLYSTLTLRRNNFQHYNKINRKCIFLISNEGIFKINNENADIKKMIIKNDNVDTFAENDNKLMFDKSDIEYIQHDKIPFKYTKHEYNEELFIVNDDINIVSINDIIWYIEFNNISNLPHAKNIIHKNV